MAKRGWTGYQASCVAFNGGLEISDHRVTQAVSCDVGALTLHHQIQVNAFRYPGFRRLEIYVATKSDRWKAPEGLVDGAIIALTHGSSRHIPLLASPLWPKTAFKGKYVSRS